MIVLDTDHLSVLTVPRGQAATALQSRLAANSDEQFATTIVTSEELLRGWLALIHRTREVHEQVAAYERLASLLGFLANWTVLAFDGHAADEFTRLRRDRIRIGTMDLKIASIALVHDATLLSANTRDFSQVPGLRVESWLG